MTDILNGRFGSTAVERCLVVDGLPLARFWPLRLTPNTAEYGLYLSVATFAPRGESGGGREPEIGWGERARV